MQRGKAEFIHTGNSLKEKSKMNFNENFERLQRLNEIKNQAKVNMLHISVNFHLKDGLTKKQMTGIVIEISRQFDLKNNHT